MFVKQLLWCCVVLVVPLPTLAQGFLGANAFSGLQGSGARGDTQSEFNTTSSGTGVNAPLGTNIPGFRNVGPANADASRSGESSESLGPQQSAQSPKPLSAFQRFLLESTGRVIPYYGEKVFQSSSRLNSGVSPVSSDYELGPGDEVLVRIWGSVNVDVNSVVDRNGQLSIPGVGTFPIAGVKARDLDAYLSAEVGRYYKNFNLSSSPGKLAGLNVFVAGQAANSGMHVVSSNSTLATVLFSVAQPGPNGSYRDVQLRRGGQTVATFDLYELLRNGNLTGDRKLQSGDVIFIGSAGTRVALNVEGVAAAIYEAKAGESLKDILEISGVDQTLLRQDNVLIEGFNQENANAPRGVEQISYTRALNEAKLRDGDVITIFPTRMEFSNAVTLKGSVADPARYPYFKGMKIADLIPSTDTLIPRSYFKKKSALVGYDSNQAERAMNDPRLFDELPYEEKLYRKQRESALKAARGTPAAPNAVDAEPIDGAQLAQVEETITSLLSEINWDYAVIERFDRKELKQVLIPFNLRKAMAGDPNQNLELQPGDVVTVLNAEDGDIPKSRRTALIKVTGEVGAPGFYQVKAGETLRDVLVKAGGLTDDAYLFGTKLTRKAMMEEQQKQLQRALDQAERLLFAAQNSNVASAITAVDAVNARAQQDNQQRYLTKLRQAKPDGRVVLDVKPNANSLAQLPPLELEDGDSIVVPAMPGQIAIFGSVYSQGAFAYQKGQTVFDYLNMAGGPSKSSDKGSIFVLRANGTVDSAQQGWVPFVSGLYGSRALPGDAIYVPEDFERVSLLKTLVDVSQVFYQIGLGAAAIKVLQDD
jgi:polysaccharide biosynthesis/export protein